MEREDIKMLVKKWWDIYEDESLDYKNTIETISDEIDISKKEDGLAKQNLGPFVTALADSGIQQSIRAPSAA